MAVARDNHVVIPAQPYYVDLLGDPVRIVAEIISISPRGVTQILQFTVDEARNVLNDLDWLLREYD